MEPYYFRVPEIYKTPQEIWDDYGPGFLCRLSNDPCYYWFKNKADFLIWYNHPTVLKM